VLAALGKAERVQVTTPPAATVLAFALFVMMAAFTFVANKKENKTEMTAKYLFNNEGHICFFKS
jgi:hypothetical protein